MGERKYRYPHFTNSKWKSSEPFREAHGRAGSSNWCLWALECCLGKTKLLHASRATGTGHRQTWFHNSVTVLQGGTKLWATPLLILHKGMDICLTQRTLQMVFPQPWGYLSARPSFWLKLVSPLSSGLAGHGKIPDQCLTLLQFLPGRRTSHIDTRLSRCLSVGYEFGTLLFVSLTQNPSFLLIVPQAYWDSIPPPGIVLSKNLGLDKIPGQKK